MKKILSLLLTFVLIMSFCVISYAEIDISNPLQPFNRVKISKEFKDVKSNTWYHDNVAIAYSFGLMNGNSDTTFNPEGNISVAETLALISRIHNIYYGGSGEFEQEKPWYKVYYNYTKENIIESREMPLFDESVLNQPIKRDMFVKF